VAQDGEDFYSFGRGNMRAACSANGEFPFARSAAVAQIIQNFRA
jgi:hypothetical protein